MSDIVELDIKIVKLNRVFTPAAPADLLFVDRGEPQRALQAALAKTGMQVLLYGDSKVGKSSLAKKVLAEERIPNIYTLCDSTTTVESMTLGALRDVGYWQVDQRTSTSSNTSEFQATADDSESGRTGKASVSHSATGNETQSQLPEPPSFDLVGKELRRTGTTWLIEDLHLAHQDVRKAISQALKKFSDMSTLGSIGQPFRVILLGVEHKADELVHYHEDLSGRLSEILIPSMSVDEISLIAKEGAKLLNVEFSASAINEIVELSGGSAVVAHSLCHEALTELGITQTVQGSRIILDHGTIEVAANRYIATQSASLSTSWNHAIRRKSIGGRYDNARVILHALSTFPYRGASEIVLKEAVMASLNYPPSNYKVYLKELCSPDRNNILRVSSGMYQFKDTQHFIFAKLHFAEAANRIVDFSQSESRDLPAIVQESAQNFDSVPAIVDRQSNDGGSAT